MSHRRPLKETLSSTLNITPKDPLSWLYVARGYYKLRDYHAVIEACTPALRNERTRKEAQHLLAFGLLHTGQWEIAAGAFLKSINLGNDTDWQVGK